MNRLISTIAKFPGRVFCKFFCREILTRMDSLERHVKYIEDLFKTSHDISAAPKAVGQMRLLQMANLAFLKQVTDVFDAHGVPYWLGSGTLIGAVRHKGFIPWDDDIDICTTRAYHNDLLKLIENEFEGTGDVFATKGDCIRIFKKGTPCQIDVFAWDELSLPDFSETTLANLKSAHDSFCAQFHYDFQRLRSFGRTITNKTDAETMEMAKRFAEMFSGPCKILMEGIEESHHTFLWMPYEVLLPTKKLEFEGLRFSAPAHPEYALERWYGDYMAYPRDFHIHSDIKNRLTLSAIDEMREMIACLK